jgi:hypothetical protein
MATKTNFGVVKMKVIKFEKEGKISEHLPIKNLYLTKENILYDDKIEPLHYYEHHTILEMNRAVFSSNFKYNKETKNYDYIGKDTTKIADIAKIIILNVSQK